MSYLYHSNLSPFDRFNKLTFRLDSGDTVIIQRGFYYDLTAGEVARASQYVFLVNSTSPANAVPLAVVELPVEGNPNNGDVPIWNSALSVFVPGPMTGGG